MNNSAEVRAYVDEIKYRIEANRNIAIGAKVTTTKLYRKEMNKEFSGVVVGRPFNDGSTVVNVKKDDGEVVMISIGWLQAV
jgi:hypothetical protein